MVLAAAELPAVSPDSALPMSIESEFASFAVRLRKRGAVLGAVSHGRTRHLRQRDIVPSAQNPSRTDSVLYFP